MVTVRYFASARAQAGATSEEWEVPDLAALVRGIGRRHGTRMVAILESSSLLVDGLATRDHSRTLDDVTEVHVLPPFAGG